MIIKFVILSVFGLLAIIGFLSSMRTRHMLRAPRNYKDPVLMWAQPALPGYKFGGKSWIGLTIHWGSVALIGAILLFKVLFSPPMELDVSNSRSTIMTLFLVPILLGGVAGAGYLWGTALFHPVSDFLGGTSHFALSADGILYMGQLLPWNSFSFFNVDAEHNDIRMWSAVFPGLLLFIFTPPSLEVRAALIENLNANMFKMKSDSNSFLHFKYAFPVVAAALSFPVVILALLANLLPMGPAVGADSILIYLLMYMGGNPLLKYVLKSRPADLA